MKKIATFDDWTDYFRKWQKDIGFDSSLIPPDYHFDALYEDTAIPEVEFGEFAGQTKWDRILQIPNQDMRDALLHLIVYQGDTEFASSEQQRNLIHEAPSDYDLKCLLRVMRDEMRHGWQMSHILVSQFGDTGKVEARKLLERRAFKGNRLLGAFNQPLENWLEFFVYTAFIDRDGKYQLTMLHHSGFSPVANSMGPMLKEESFHLFTGQTGLTRVVKEGKVPSEIVQKYLNKWVSAAYDLFGKDRSTSALRFYRWGFKGRFNEDKSLAPPKELERLNEEARSLYAAEVQEILDGLNHMIPEGQSKLSLPDVRFNRKIGEFADKTFGVDGRSLTDEEHRRHLQEALPTADDQQKLQSIFKAGSWLSEVKDAA